MTIAPGDRALEWHKKRFPDAKIEHVAMKLAEEAGEVCKAINGRVGEQSATGGGDMMEELADVMICCFVLAGRWDIGSDLQRHVEDKLALLENSNGTHRASLGGMK